MLASIRWASGRGFAPHTRPGSLAIASGSPTANPEPRFSLTLARAGSAVIPVRHKARFVHAAGSPTRPGEGTASCLAPLLES
jgi:hypothetical protein